MKDIAKGLKHNKCLRMLIMESNSITVKAVDEIGFCLMANKTLEQLNLDNNKLGKERSCICLEGVKKERKKEMSLLLFRRFCCNDCKLIIKIK